jgi:hypothetical protein
MSTAEEVTAGSIAKLEAQMILSTDTSTSSLSHGASKNNLDGGVFKEPVSSGSSTTREDLVEQTVDEKRHAADGQAHLPHVEGAQLWILVTM